MLNYGLSQAQWDPFAELRQLQSQMNRMFEGGGRSQRASDGNWPPVNMWLGDESVVVTAEMPGVGKDDIDLTVELWRMITYTYAHADLRHCALNLAMLLIVGVRPPVRPGLLGTPWRVAARQPQPRELHHLLHS